MEAMGPVAELLARIQTVLEMIKFKHSVFALPFALAAMLVAADGLPPAGVIFWIVAACVFARSGAMTFNRLVDLPFDRRNPRTAGRALVTGALSPPFAWGFLAVNVAGFVVSAAMLNPLCLVLSPVALAVALGYSLVKRFSSATHFVLGLALAVAPMGAWLAVAPPEPLLQWPVGAADLAAAAFLLAPPLWLALAVVCWTAGFDIVYACQDKDIDRQLGLWSIPARFDLKRALQVSAVLHACMLVALGLFWWTASLGPVTVGAIGVIAVLLWRKHRMVAPDDLSRVQVAFFTVNGLISVAFLLGVALDVAIRTPGGA